jgi:uncharacterized protein (DUF58 family)
MTSPISKSSDQSHTRTDVHHRAEALAGGLPPLMVAAERVASTVSQGVHGRRRVGQGETFWQFRRYEFGDSIQMVDWRQSAKSEPVYIRELEWEAAQSVWIWRDGSPSMAFRSDEQLKTKSDRADLLLLALASLLVRGGERIAIQGTGTTPASGRNVPARMCSMIEAGQVSTSNLPESEVLPRYARVIWFGDFLSPLEDVKQAIRSFANQGIRGHLVQVIDPAESLLPYDGRVLFGAMEDADTDVLVRHAGSLRDDYQAAFSAHQAGLRDMCSETGWSFIDHRTDHAPEPVLLSLYLHFSESRD